jgi:hypothetical protein
MSTALVGEIGELERAVARWLVARLEPDGLWRDFSLQPGRSDLWSSAWIGWGLAHVQDDVRVAWALQTVVRSLGACARPEGWGYNQRTSCDADSTAWVVRLFAVVSPAAAQRAMPALLRYVDPFGEAHTFVDPMEGRWSGAHPDVTVMAGLAALDGGAAPGVIHRIRRAVVAGAAFIAPAEGRLGERCSGPLPSFWWANPTYRLCWTLCFLSRCGGIPAALGADSNGWLASQTGVDMPPFERALQLLALLALGRVNDDLVAWHVCRLLDSCRGDHWNGSAGLLVPPKQMPDTGGLAIGPHVDSGAMTTSLVLAALARWRRAATKGSATGQRRSSYFSHPQGATS